jgi:hypothetical protein
MSGVTKSDLRLLLVDHSDRLISELDVRTERQLLLLHNESDENEKKQTVELNELRQSMIDEIKRVESANLVDLEQLDVEGLLESYDDLVVKKAIFKSFCFLLDVGKLRASVTETATQINDIYLFVVDEYLTKESIDCYVEFLGHVNNEKQIATNSCLFKFNEKVGIFLFPILQCCQN